MRMKRAQWQEVVDVNLTGVYLCAQVISSLAWRPNMLLTLMLCPRTSIFCYPVSGRGGSNDEEEKGTERPVLVFVKRFFICTMIKGWNNLRLADLVPGKDHQHRVSCRDHRQHWAGQLLRCEGRGDRTDQGHG